VVGSLHMVGVATGRRWSGGGRSYRIFNVHTVAIERKKADELRHDSAEPRSSRLRPTSVAQYPLLL
jgi:hypothetical protein